MALTDNLISYWKLDEASGDRVDSHASLDLTDTNTVTSDTGKINSAAHFAAANSERLLASSDSTLDMHNRDFTVACWINLESDPGVFGFRVACQRSVGGGSFEIRITNNNPNLQLQFSWADTNSITKATVLSTGTWYFVVASRSVADSKIYLSLDGDTPTEAATTVDEAGGAANFAIGGRTDGTLPWDGLIDEFGVWSRVLTSQERTELYNSGNGLAYPFTGGAKPFLHYAQQMAAF